MSKTQGSWAVSGRRETLQKLEKMKNISLVHSKLRSRSTKISPERNEEASREMILKKTET